ncbi:MAG: hypothetical protein LRZ88_03245 [Candidatus Cloacimonetes bacterium]|nr:hypothetical protein [Candidatus Cloacimonadota bacterium]
MCKRSSSIWYPPWCWAIVVFFWPKIIFYILSGMTGYSLGLMFSGMIKDRSAVINILPLVIIPPDYVQWSGDRICQNEPLAEDQ